MCVCVCVCVCVCLSVCLAIWLSGCLSVIISLYVGVIFVYIDTVYGFNGYSFICLVGYFSMIIWTLTVLKVLYACVLYFVFAPVQRNWACFMWKGALEIYSFFFFFFFFFILFLSSLVFHYRKWQSTSNPTFSVLCCLWSCCFLLPQNVISPTMMWSSSWSYTLGYLPFCTSNGPSIVFQWGSVPNLLPFCFCCVFSCVSHFCSLSNEGVLDSIC